MKKLPTLVTALLLLSATQTVTASPKGQTPFKASTTVEATVTIPEELTIPMSDNPDSINITVNTSAAYSPENSYVTLNTTDANGNTDYTIVSLSYARGEEGLKFYPSSFKGKTGTVYVTASVSLRDENYKILGTYTTNQCKLTVTAPTIPVTSMKYDQSEITSKLIYYSYKEPSLVFSPSNATYTHVTVSNEGEYFDGYNGNRWDFLAQEGEGTVIATYDYDPTVTASYKLIVKCEKPVTEIKINGDSIIEVEPYTLLDLPDLTVTPADADCMSFNTYSMKYTADDPNIADWWRTRKFIKVITPGETKVTISAADQKGAKTEFKIKVNEPDRTAYDGYQDGALILADGWRGYDFGGVINHLKADGTMIYRAFERENPDMALGNVKSIASYGGKIYVKSEQLNGNPYLFQMKEYTGTIPTWSGSYTVLDGKTLKKETDTELTDSEIDEITSSLKVGNYIFNIGSYQSGRKIVTGLKVTDAESGETLKKVEGSNNGESLMQLANGKIWFCIDGNKLIDPATLEVEDCSFAPICADPKNNVVWTVSNGTNCPDTEIKRYDIDTQEEKLLVSIESLPCNFINGDTLYQTITSTAYDPKTENLIVTTKEYTYSFSALGDANCWVLTIDGTTGEVKSSIQLRQYYWNNLMTIVPDKYAPEFNVESSVTLCDEDPALTIDLTDKVTDKDNIDYNIITTLDSEGDPSVANVSLEGKTLTIKPVGVGETKITLAAESNGVTTTHDIAIVVMDKTAINDINADVNNTVKARYSVGGNQLDTPQKGVNIIKTTNGKSHKVVVK